MTQVTTLVELILAVHGGFAGSNVGHAFGGALALAYVAEPRGTVDIDVNVFLPVGEIDIVVDALRPLGLEPERELSAWLPVAGIRFRDARHPFPLDVFPSLDTGPYGEIARRCVVHPFGPDAVELPFLSAEDLTMFKLSFGRSKDWVDIQSIIKERRDLDVAYVERQLIGLRGPAMHPRIARLRQMVRIAEGQ